MTLTDITAAQQPATSAGTNTNSLYKTLPVRKKATSRCNEHGIINRPDGSANFTSQSGKTIAQIQYALVGKEWISGYHFRIHCGNFLGASHPLSISNNGFPARSDAFLFAARRLHTEVQNNCKDISRLTGLQQKEITKLTAWVRSLIGAYQPLKPSMPLEGRKFVDLFAGIGGFHEALKQQGAICVAAVELDAKARETYLENHGHDGLRMYTDIRDVKPEELPEFDILVGGFPCQSFSIAGNRQGYDAQEKGALFFEIVRIAASRKPSLLILENVEGFATHDDGRTADTAIRELTKIGYSASMQVLSASEFGVPQLRKRIFIVAVRLDCIRDDQSPFAFPLGSSPTKVVSDLLEEHVSEGFRNRVMLPDKTIRSDRTGLIPLGRIDGMKFQTHRVYSPDAQGPTMCTSGSGLYLIDGKIRTLTPRECARMQGFPDTFKLNPSKQQARKQFGNAVAVPVVSAVALEASKFLNNNN